MLISQPAISVLIVTYNRKSDLLRCIESVHSQSFIDYEIVIVDNNSSDGTSELIRSSFPNIKLICSSKNLGCPSGRNLGFANCVGKYIYCLDDDGWLNKYALETAFQRAESDSQIAIVQSKIFECTNGILSCERPPYNEAAYLNTFSGGCSLIRHDVLFKTGNYPDNFVRQAEEEDLSLRIFDAGYFCILEPNSIMYHAASPVNRNNLMTTYFNLRNMLIIGLTRWPFPWNFFRVLSTGWHTMKQAVLHRSLFLPLMMSVAFIRVIINLKSTRHPVSRKAFSLFIKLKHNPTTMKP